MERQLPTDIAARLKRWERISQGLRALQVVLAIVAIVCSLLVTSRITEPSYLPKELFSFTAALAVTLLSGLDLGVRANRYRNAWRTLYFAAKKYEEEPDFSLEQLRASHGKAEDLIGDYSVRTS